jgi:nucleotide-binding universal stress UspA family protein
MKKILLPTDFSETSDNAFIYALEMARILNAELVLLHTFDLPITDSQAIPVSFGLIYETIELKNFDHFKEHLPKLRELAAQRNLDNIDMKHILMDGDLISNIKKVVTQENIDFVVMGTKGTSGWSEVFFGTNTGSVIEGVSVPVLCVPLEATFVKIESIAFTTRYRKKDIVALNKVLIIAKKLHAKVKCLYVKTSDSDVTQDEMKRWESHFEEEPIQFFVLPSDHVEQTIEDFLIDQGIDVLAMLTYKRNFFVALFSHTLTQKLSFHLRTPILVMHE